MSNSLRSKQGCWTCRLRKKKCDEARPHCSTCISLSITCYGFGTRPDWMDDGEKEKSIANGIKEVVKRTSRRRTATTQVPKSRTSTIILAPKPSNSSSENSSQSPKPNLELGTDSTMHHEPPREQADRTIQAESNTITTNSVPEDFHPLEHYDVATSGTIPISMDDSILLMHFLDNVFPLQYPMYTPEVLDGGRGWLLANLLQSKPLYYAVLAISSYHHRMIVLEKLDHPCQIAALIQQEKHLEVCLSLVNHYAKNSCPTNGLGIATCIVQLVFYEVIPDSGEQSPALTSLLSSLMAILTHGSHTFEQQ
jgi:hypothetical protein